MAKVVFEKKRSLKEKLHDWTCDNAEGIALCVTGVVTGGVCCAVGYFVGRADGMAKGYRTGCRDIGSAAADVCDCYIDKCGLHGAKAMAEHLGANLDKIDWAAVEKRYVSDEYIQDRLKFVSEMRNICPK